MQHVAGGAPLILLGDLNSLPGSGPYRALTRYLSDVRELVPATRPVRTFPTWFSALAVDHIFVNAALQPLSYRDRPQGARAV
jgi:endonuclease/exonuclease/phosphatase family metal-dependent hydrolase